MAFIQSCCTKRATFALVEQQQAEQQQQGQQQGQQQRQQQKKRPRPRWCKQHAPMDAVDVRSKRCIFCSAVAWYRGRDRASGRFYCRAHAPDGAVRDVTRVCSVCGVPIHNNRMCCRGCSGRGDVLTVRLWEHMVTFHLRAALRIGAGEAIVSMTTNERVGGAGGGGGAARPDILLQCANGRAVVVEVDEHQHTSYDVAQEVQRMYAIQEALARPTVFLRFNPHTFKRHGQGRANHVPLQQRLEQVCALVQVLAAPRTPWVPHLAPPPPLQVMYLFYDDA